MDETEIEQKLNEMMNKAINKCGDCSKIRECWALKNIEVGQNGHIELRRPYFESNEPDFKCNVEENWKKN